MSFRKLFTLCLALSAGMSAHAGLPDRPFLQEIHRPYPIGTEPASSNARAVAVDSAGNVWAATRTGVYILESSSGTWRAVLPDSLAGPSFDILVAPDGTVWLGTWTGLFAFRNNRLQAVPSLSSPVATVGISGKNLYAFGPDGSWSNEGGKWHRLQFRLPGSVRAFLSDGRGGFWLATAVGLYHVVEGRVEVYRDSSELISADVRALAVDPQGRLWIGSLGGVTVYEQSRRVDAFTPKDGLPTVWVNCVAKAPDGRMWVGTDLGLARYDGRSWSVRHSRRWLLDDHVRDIAFDRRGTVWIATAKGVSAILRRRMTLAQKAQHFYRICMTRHVREPWLVEKCRLRVPGDTTTWEPRDDDNDGQYTAMYLAMESFRYAATRDPEAKEHAKRAFEALRFLQTVTGTESFVARTVIPPTWTRMADPNEIISPRRRAERRVRNPRDKCVETHWHRSADGRWLWKGDTSSDEITGHMYGYLFYHDLVADATEKRRVAEHVCRVVDGLIQNGYVLKGMDGKHTTWGVWAPEYLNHDPDWTPERGINSVEILSYLKLAYHVSGEKRYEREYRKLLFQEGYAENVKNAKNFNPAFRTHIDDELLALAYPCLLLHEKDPQLRSLYRQSLDRWYQGVRGDKSSFFDFTYALCTGENPQPEASLFDLRDTSLDLVRWRIDNSRREDLRLVRTPELESLQTDRLLPPSERCLTRWDGNPWLAIQGDGAQTESSGVWWLLAYWLGRYLGVIGE